MNSSKDDCRKRTALGRQLFLVCSFFFLPADFSPARADSWQQRSAVPGGRAAHSAVWTGRELIVWGGGIDGSFLNTGARYVPSTDTWRPTTPYGAPSPRWFHAAVWTGHEMILWGGRANFFPHDHSSDGARYNPTTDTWTPMSTEGALTPRSQFAAVWTGAELIVWGGQTEGGVELNDGARYDPETDIWSPISDTSGLEPRMEPTAIWTGEEMIVYGGMKFTGGQLSFGNGARYSPVSNTWRPLPSEGAPGSRTGHTAAWTGERMIIWGGREMPAYEVFNDGSIYNPGSDTWTPIPFSYDAPQARMYHAAVWTGSEMIIWGGHTDASGILLNTGARYNPATGVWTSTTQDNAPGKRMFWRPDLGIWTGSGMLVCAGSDYPTSLDSTYLYSLVDPPCPPVIREQPQNVSVVVGSPVTLAVGAGDCATAAHPSATQTSVGPYPQGFEFQTGVRMGQLQFDYEFFNIPDSLRVYYDGERIFDSDLSGQGTIRVPFGPGFARSVNIVVNEDGGPANTAWEYTVSFRPSPLHYQWRKNGAALTGETNATLHFQSVSLGDAGDYSVVVANNNSAVVSSVATLTVQPFQPTNCISGLVAWWRGDGDATDATGAHDGTLLFGTTFSPGLVGQAFTFDLSRARVSIPDDDAFKLTDSLSFEGWINVASLASGIIFIRGDNRPGLDPYHMGIEPSGQLHWAITTAESNFTGVMSPGAVATGVWMHVAAVLDGATGNMGLYLNGSLVSQTNTSLRPLRDLDPNWEPALGIGNAGGTFHHFPFHGSVDEWALYSRALNEAEIVAIYNAGSLGKCSTTNSSPTNCAAAPAGLAAWWRFDGTGKDSISGTDLVTSGGPAFVAGKVGQALRFDGVDDRARASASAALNVGTNEGFSIETWVNPQSVTLQPLVVWSPVGNIGGAHFWLGGYGAGSIYANVVDVNGGQHSWRSDTGLVVVNEWQHVGMSYDKPSGLLRFYRNGEKVTEYALGSFTPLTGSDVRIGYNEVGHEHFVGALDELSIYRRILSDAEMRSIYDAGAAGKCSVTSPPPPVAVTFDLSRDFSASSNPTGAWSYGYLASLDGPFMRLTFAKDFTSENGVPLSAWQVSDNLAPGVARVMGNRTAVSEGGAFTAPPGTVWIAPGNDGSPGLFGVIRFTVPVGSSGLYRIESTVRSNFDGPVSGDSDFHVLDNGHEVFGRFLLPNSGVGYSNTLALAAGETIDFAVGRGADGSPDHSSLKVHAVVALVTNAPPPTNQMFDLSGDFSLAANPNGPWSYGHLTGSLGGSFELLNTTRTFGAENGVPIAIWQLNNNKPWVAKVLGPDTAVSFHFNGPPGTIYFGPDPDAVPQDFATIRFTVPPGAGGTYRLETSVRSLYDSTRSVDADFHVVKNGAELFGRLVPPNSGTGYSNTLVLAVGDRIDFVAGRGTNGLPNTGLKIQATLRSIAQTSMGVDAVSVLAAGGVRVTGHAPHGMICRVERSMDLVDWEPAGSTVAAASGVFEFIDSQPPAGTACFYRLSGSEP